MRNYEKLRETLNILGIFLLKYLIGFQKKNKNNNYCKLSETKRNTR